MENDIVFGLTRLARDVVADSYKVTPQTVNSARLQFLKEMRGVKNSYFKELEKVGFRDQKAWREKKLTKKEKENLSWYERDIEYDHEEYSYKVVLDLDAYEKIVKALGKVLRRMSQAYEKYFYEVILGRHMAALSRGKKSDELSSLANYLQSSAWVFVLSMSAHELDTRYRKHEDYEKSANYVFNRIQKLGREAFKDAKSLAEYGPEAGKEYDFAGVANWDRFSFIPEGGLESVNMERAIRSFQNAVKKIRGAGYGIATKGKMDVIVTAKNDQLIAAYYRASDDSMKIRPLGLDAETVIHEFGHRLYYQNMSPGDRNRWAELYSGDVFELSREDVKRVIAEMPEPENKTYETKRDVERGIKNYVKKWQTKDPLAYDKGKLLARNISMGGVTSLEGYKATAKYWNHFVGEAVMKSFISDYGNTNEKEAFAELFMHIVTGRNTNKRALAWFRSIVK